MKSSPMLAAILLSLAATGGVERKAAKINNDANGLFTKDQYDAARIVWGCQIGRPNRRIAYNLATPLPAGAGAGLRCRC